jgi:hypothetical protein
MSSDLHSIPPQKDLATSLPTYAPHINNAIHDQLVELPPLDVRVFRDI